MRAANLRLRPFGDSGRLALSFPNWGSGWRWDRFVSRTVTSVAFSDDAGFAPGHHSQPTVDTVVFAGIGEWNGQPGYRYELRAQDRGEPGRGLDTHGRHHLDGDEVQVHRQVPEPVLRVLPGGGTGGSARSNGRLPTTARSASCTISS